MIQAILITFLNIVLRFLEAVTQTKSTEKENFFSGNSSSPSTASSDALLQEAYEFMELTPPVEIDKVSKQYKRLSLRYHPDRNQGSQESHDLQQKLNASFDRIQQALEGPSQHPEEDEIIPEPEQDVPDFDDIFEQANKMRNRRQKNNQKKRRSTKKQRREGNRRQKEMRQQMEKEMREEQQRWEAMRADVEEEKTKISKENYAVLDLERRAADSINFMNKVESKKDSSNQAPNTQDDSQQTTTADKEEKPKNWIIETCTDELAVAIKLGKAEYTMELFDKECDSWINKKIQELAERARYEGRRELRFTERDLGVKEIRLLVMTQRLDADGNTALHYAVYWEQAPIIRVLVELAQTDGQLDGLMSAKNIHGHLPIDFATVATDPTILPLMQAQENLVKIHREQTQIGPAIKKAFRQSLVIVKKTHWGTVLTSLLGYCVGRFGFRLHWVFALWGLSLLQVSTLENGDRYNLSSIASMLTFYTVIIVAINVVKLVYDMFLWEMLLLTPVLLLCCCCCGCEPAVFVLVPLGGLDIMRDRLYHALRLLYQSVIASSTLEKLFSSLGPFIVRSILLMGILATLLGVQYLYL